MIFFEKKYIHGTVFQINSQTKKYLTYKNAKRPSFVVREVHDSTNPAQ